MAASAKVEDFADCFDWEFAFTVCKSSSARSPFTQVQREHAIFGYLVCRQWGFTSHDRGT